jgi:hypothetical protein
MARAAVLALGALLMGVAPAAAAPVDDALFPTERYDTPKGRALDAAYRPHLVRLHDYLYHCVPWVAVQKNGIGFRTPRGSTTDDRFVYVWIWIDQKPDAGFAASPRHERASAMFSRYGVPLLRRMHDIPGLAGDPRVAGYAVVLSWVKPGSIGPGQATNETLTVFADRAGVPEFLARTLGPAEFAERSRVSLWDGQSELGRVPLAITDDSFLGTFKLPGYQPPPGQSC